MKILMITTISYGGGVYTHTLEISDILKKKHKITVIGGDSKKFKHYFKNGIEFYEIPYIFSLYHYYFITSKKYKKLIENLIDKNDIIHIQTPIFSFVSDIIKKKKKPIAYTFHIPMPENKFLCFLFKKIVKLILKKLNNVVDVVFYLNPDYKNFLKEIFPNKKLVRINNAVNVNLFRPKKKRKKRKHRIIYFGRLSKEKNVDKLIRAFKLIEKKVNAELIVIGDGPSYKICKIIGNSKNIKIKGFLKRKKLIEYLQNSDVCVFPSIGENFPLVHLEAMACEIPVISTGVGYFKKMKKLYYLIKKPNVLEISKKIIFVLNNLEKARKKAKKARKYIIRKFSWKKTAKKMENVYKKMVSELVYEKKFKGLEKKKAV